MVKIIYKTRLKALILIFLWFNLLPEAFNKTKK